ncbi:hypothetical protein [Sodalis-like endosymbiont of Proechinophthirus fluctus]|nr:hypothetical protein [Sodalis-like endosymbiont of Proechinophthirus fluctus]
MAGHVSERGVRLISLITGILVVAGIFDVVASSDASIASGT